MSKSWDRLGSLVMIKQLVLKENFTLKQIDMSHPAQGGGVG